MIEILLYDYRLSRYSDVKNSVNTLPLNASVFATSTNRYLDGFLEDQVCFEQVTLHELLSYPRIVPLPEPKNRGEGLALLDRFAELRSNEIH